MPQKGVFTWRRRGPGRGQLFGSSRFYGGVAGGFPSSRGVFKECSFLKAKAETPSTVVLRPPFSTPDPKNCIPSYRCLHTSDIPHWASLDHVSLSSSCSPGLTWGSLNAKLYSILITTYPSHSFPSLIAATLTCIDHRVSGELKVQRDRTEKQPGVTSGDCARTMSPTCVLLAKHCYQLR